MQEIAFSKNGHLLADNKSTAASTIKTMLNGRGSTPTKTWRAT